MIINKFTEDKMFDGDKNNNNHFHLACYPSPGSMPRFRESKNDYQS
jgi:hypothetical protein